MDKQTLIDNLNKDLAGELSAVIQYITYAAKATGPYRPQLVQFFLAEVQDEIMHAQFLANKIVALGGDLSKTLIYYFASEYGFIGIFFTVLFIVASIYITLRLDWEKLFTKYLGREKGKNEP